MNPVQTEFFPKTQLDDANAVLSKLLSDEEKAEKAIATAEDKLSQVQTLIYRQRRVITHLQTEMPAADPPPVVEAEEDLEDAEFEPLAIEGDVLDPLTGEVTSKGESDNGDKNLVGEVTPHVFVVWPNTTDPVRTDVGEHTTYGELVADYIEATEPGEDVEDFMVVRVDDGGLECSLNTPIVAWDYGKTFRIERTLGEEALVEREANVAEESAA